MKNPQSKIEVEAKVEDLEELSSDELMNTSQTQTQTQQHLAAPNEEKATKPISPTIGPKSTLAGSGGSNGVEALKISQNALENVKLRSTVRNKLPPPPTTTSQAQQAQQQANSGSSDESATGRIANRLSLFEQHNKHEALSESAKPPPPPPNHFMNVKLKKTSNDQNLGELVENNSEGAFAVPFERVAL